MKLLQTFWTQTLFLFLTFILILNSTAIAQNEKTLFPVKDNTLYESASGDLSNGAGMHFFAGNSGGNLIRRGLVSFAIGDSIPAGSNIDSVKLTLHMSRSNAGGTTVSLHRVEADWGEGSSIATGDGGGEGNGGTASAGDATWIHTFFSSANWSTTGGDFSATESSNQTVTGIGDYTWGSTVEMVADVQDWLDNPANNFGWIVLGDESSSGTAKRFDSRENPTEGNRPKLTVIYTPTTSVSSEILAPSDFVLHQNYPNPFNPSTTINFRLAKSGLVTLKIFDLSGRGIKTLIEGPRDAGVHTVTWDGTNQSGQPIASGIYVYRLQADEFSQAAKMMFIQ